jgi:murein DD-endopeptidase MepM/ murein hydrolase activator NlpD
MRTSIGLVLALAGLATSTAAQEPTPIEVRWSPASPFEGSFAVITLIGPSGATAVEGSLAGEPLHFVAEGDGVFRAFAAFPIGSSDTVALPLTVRGRNGGRRTVTASIPVARGTFSVEQLTVSPAYGRKPDSATAARIAAETARAIAIYRRSHTTAPLWASSFQRPLESRVTSEFGQGRQFNGTIRSRHLGVDLDGVTGTAVRATNRAVVALVDEFYYSGNVVYLDHGAGLVTAYMHLSSTEVSPGDTVVAGQVIGRVGATGRVTGPHLHWTARYGRVAVDPLSLVALEVEELPSAR